MGCVYILKNKAMPGLIKIGYTQENAEKRANELYTTGVPQPFEVVYELDKLESEQYEKLEVEIHKALDQYRVNPKREFFEYPADEAIRLLRKLHSSVIKESRHPRWLKWIPNLRGFRSEKNENTENSNDDNDESDPDETNTTNTYAGGTFMSDEQGNGATPSLNGKSYYSHGFMCAAAARGVPDALQEHINVIIRDEDLEIRLSHAEINTQIKTLNDEKTGMESLQKNFQDDVKKKKQEIADQEVQIAGMKARLDAPPETEVMSTPDPDVNTLRNKQDGLKEQLADKQIERAVREVVSAAPTLTELSETPLKPRWSWEKISITILGTLMLLALGFYIYHFYVSIPGKAFAPRTEATGEEALNQFVDFNAFHEAWNTEGATTEGGTTKTHKNWFVLLFPSIFFVFAYVTHFFFTRAMQEIGKWTKWLLPIIVGLTLIFDGIIAVNIAENMGDIKKSITQQNLLKMQEKQLSVDFFNTGENNADGAENNADGAENNADGAEQAPGWFQKFRSYWLDVSGVIFLGFVASVLLGIGCWCNTQDWLDILRPTGKQIEAEKNRRTVKLTKVASEIEALQSDINSLDTQIDARVKAHRHPLREEIDRFETENQNKVAAVDDLNAEVSILDTKIGKCQKEIDELRALLKRPEKESIDIEKMERHVNEFVSGWNSFLVWSKGDMTNNTPEEIKNTQMIKTDVLEAYKKSLVDPSA